jgi:hypothetical protein
MKTAHGTTIVTEGGQEGLRSAEPVRDGSGHDRIKQGECLPSHTPKRRDAEVMFRPLVHDIMLVAEKHLSRD